MLESTIDGYEDIEPISEVFHQLVIFELVPVQIEGSLDFFITGKAFDDAGINASASEDCAQDGRGVSARPKAPACFLFPGRSAPAPFALQRRARDLVNRDVAAQLQKGKHLSARDVGIKGEKIVDGFAGFQKINECFDGNAGIGEAGSSVHHIFVYSDDSGERLFLF